MKMLKWPSWAEVYSPDIDDDTSVGDTSVGSVIAPDIAMGVDEDVADIVDSSFGFGDT